MVDFLQLDICIIKDDVISLEGLIEEMLDFRFGFI